MNYSGVHVFRQQNPLPWWLIFGGLNGVLLLILGVRAVTAWFFGGTSAGFLWAVIVLLVLNAVLVPVMVVQLRKRIVIDFDRGTLGTERTGPMPASEFTVIVDHHRTFPQSAHLLEICFQGGAVSVESGAFAQSERLRQRSEALVAFIWQWLQAPQQHRSLIGPGAVPGITRYAVGKQEATEVLRLG